MILILKFVRTDVCAVIVNHDRKEIMDFKTCFKILNFI